MNPPKRVGLGEAAGSWVEASCAKVNFPAVCVPIFAGEAEGVGTGAVIQLNSESGEPDVQRYIAACAYALDYIAACIMKLPTMTQTAEQSAGRGSVVSFAECVGLAVVFLYDVRTIPIVSHRPTVYGFGMAKAVRPVCVRGGCAGSCEPCQLVECVVGSGFGLACGYAG